MTTMLGFSQVRENELDIQVIWAGEAINHAGGMRFCSSGWNSTRRLPLDVLTAKRHTKRLAAMQLASWDYPQRSWLYIYWQRMVNSG